VQNSIVDIRRKQAQVISEPVSRADAKAWAIIDHINDDALIDTLITEVRNAIENKTKKSLVKREVTVVAYLNGQFKLPYGPVRSIDSVVFNYGTISETLTTAEYSTIGLDNKIFCPKKCGTYQITFTAGYGQEGDFDTPVPDDLKNGIKQEIAYRYEHRGDETNTKSSAGNETVNAIDGVSSGALKYIKPYIGMAWV